MIDLKEFFIIYKTRIRQSKFPLLPKANFCQDTVILYSKYILKYKYFLEMRYPISLSHNLTNKFIEVKEKQVNNYLLTGKKVSLFYRNELEVS